MRAHTLSREALDRILAAAAEPILIGGQALVVWADYFGVDAGREFPRGVTFDVDFLGSAADAKKLHAALGGKLYIPTLDDVTTQAAKLYIENFEGGELEVDFMAAILGGEEGSIRKRVLTLEVNGARIRVLHPFDVLRTRVINLHILKSRARDARYVAQAELAIRVLHAYLSRALHDGQERLVLKAVEALVKLADSTAGRDVWRTQGLDIMKAVPADEISAKNFHELRWPQIQSWLGRWRKRS